MFAKIIAIEGPDKVGKQTQTEMLAHALRRYGDRVALVEVPFNDGATHRLIYWMLRAGHAKANPNLFQFVHFLNKVIFQWTYLLWLRVTCDFVVLDRWSLSAVVYGDATGTNAVFNRVLYCLLKQPHLTLVLHGPSFKRNSTVDDFYERDTDLQKAVRRGYHDWVQQHPFDHELVDNQGTKDEVHDRIYDAVMSMDDELDDGPWDDQDDYGWGDR